MRIAVTIYHFKILKFKNISFKVSYFLISYKSSKRKSIFCPAVKAHNTDENSDQKLSSASMSKCSTEIYDIFKKWQILYKALVRAPLYSLFTM